MKQTDFLGFKSWTIDFSNRYKKTADEEYEIKERAVECGDNDGPEKGEELENNDEENGK